MHTPSASCVLKAPQARADSLAVGRALAARVEIHACVLAARACMHACMHACKHTYAWAHHTPITQPRTTVRTHVRTHICANAQTRPHAGD